MCEGSTATISGNTVTGFPSGDGISIQGASTATATAPAGAHGLPGGAPVTISGNSVVGDVTNKMNGFGISASVTGRGQGNPQVEAHLTTLNPLSASGLGAFAGKRVAVRTGSNCTACTLPAGV